MKKFFKILSDIIKNDLFDVAIILSIGGFYTYIFVFLIELQNENELGFIVPILAIIIFTFFTVGSMAFIYYSFKPFIQEIFGLIQALPNILAENKKDIGVFIALLLFVSIIVLFFEYLI